MDFAKKVLLFLFSSEMNNFYFLMAVLIIATDQVFGHSASLGFSIASTFWMIQYNVSMYLEDDDEGDDDDFDNGINWENRLS